MSLKSTGALGLVCFDAGVKFCMRDEAGRSVLVAIESEVLDFFEGEIRDDDVACFRRHRAPIERIASGLYDGGALEDGRIFVTYPDLRRL